jgi:hypothetical protein
VWSDDNFCGTFGKHRKFCQKEEEELLVFDNEIDPPPPPPARSAPAREESNVRTKHTLPYHPRFVDLDRASRSNSFTADADAQIKSSFQKEDLEGCSVSELSEKQGAHER